MLFAFSIGSFGLDNQQYSLYVPFSFSSGRKLSLEEDNFEGELLGLQFKIEKHHYTYSLKVFPFNTENEAKTFLNKLLPSMYWVAIKQKTGIHLSKNVEEIKLFEEPITVSEKSNMFEMVREAGWTTLDGDYYSDKLSIIPEHKKLSRWEMGRPTITLGLGPENFKDLIEESISRPSINSISENKMLCLAIEMYSSFSFELTESAKFIKLITVLESLVPECRIPESSIRFLTQTKEWMKSERTNLQAQGHDVTEINSLLSRVGDLSKASIGQAIVKYLNDVGERIPKLEITEGLLQQIKSAYGIRSQLLHSGEFDEGELKESLNLLIRFIPNLLEELFKECSE
jgi:hypothetical protein